MSDRYSRIFNLPDNLYCEGSPIIIAAGALLKDNQTGRVLAQLKFRSICNERITAIKVRITGYDMAKDAVCTEDYQYLDLRLERDQTCGNREALVMSDPSVRSFTVTVTAVFIGEDDVYADEGKWLPLQPQKSLETLFFDEELVKQYRIRTTENSNYIPCDQRDLWLCSCGEINHYDEEDCYACGFSYREVTSALELDSLQSERDERIEDEAIENERTERRRDKTHKIIITLVVLIALIGGVAGGAMLYLSKAAATQEAYAKAAELFEKGDYANAALAFEALGSYEDSSVKAEEAHAKLNKVSAYNKACQYLSNGEYDKAYDAFYAMGNYEDSVELAKEARYLKAMNLNDTGDVESAREIFISLGDYKDSVKISRRYDERLLSTTDSNDALCGGELTTTYGYDENGVLAVKIMHYSVYPALTDVVNTYNYKSDGSYTVTDGAVVHYYDSNDCYIGDDGEVSYVYDCGFYDNGVKKYEEVYLADGQTFNHEMLYDEYGNPTSRTNDEGTVYRYTNTYENGQLVRVEISGGNGSENSTTTYEYNENGTLAKEIFISSERSSVKTYNYGLVYIPNADLM